MQRHCQGQYQSCGDNPRQPAGRRHTKDMLGETNLSLDTRLESVGEFFLVGMSLLVVWGICYGC